MSAEVHINDIGTIFKLTIKDGTLIVDVSSQTTMNIVFTKPDGQKVVKAASFLTNGVDGIIKYTTLANDIDQVGKWKIQAHIVIDDGTFFSDITEFRVDPNL